MSNYSSKQMRNANNTFNTDLDNSLEVHRPVKMISDPELREDLIEIVLIKE